MAKIAFLFPGQGAQTVGMGKDFVESFPVAARVFAQAADILGWDVAKVCFEGPKEELDRTAVSQPAILTTSLAILAAIAQAGGSKVQDCAAVAGLSLGEYSALVMAGAMNFTDALRLVQKRGQFMEEACQENPGIMMSVLGLEDDIIKAVCAQARVVGLVIAANFNSPGQVVISGTREGVERAAEIARDRGAKRVVPLAVSGAFHSPLMEPAAKKLQEELAKVSISPCRKTVIANVSATPVSDPESIRVALAWQVRSPVLWSQSVRRLVEEGCDTFVEVGPGKVLAGLMKRIAPEYNVENISSADVLCAKRQAIPGGR